MLADIFHLPFSWGECGHTFCLDCLWRALTIIEGEITYPMCRSSGYDFAQNEDMASYMRENRIQPERSPREMEIVKLQFLYLLLAVRDHLVALDHDHDWNEVAFDPSLPPPPTDYPGLFNDLAQGLDGYFSDSDSDGMLDDEEDLPFRVGGAGVDDNFERRVEAELCIYSFKGFRCIG